MTSNNSRRGITPQDPRLSQIADMRSRGLSQSRMAEAIGCSQQTVSRLCHYLDGLSSEQSEKLTGEQQPNRVMSYFAAWDAWNAIAPELREGASSAECAAYAKQRDEFVAAELKRRGFK